MSVPTVAVSRKPTFMRPEMMPWALITELHWMSEKLLERRLQHHGLSAAQARVLALLYFAVKPMRPSALATLLFVEAGTMSGIVYRIVERGWVMRLPAPLDRRAIDLSLTAAGRDVAAEVIAASETLYEELFEDVLTVGEARAAAAVLRKLRAAAFELPEADFRLRRTQQHVLWRA